MLHNNRVELFWALHCLLNRSAEVQRFTKMYVILMERIIEFRKFETNFFLKCIVANIFPVMNFCLKWFLLQDAFMNQAQYLGLYYDQRLRDIAPNFSPKIVRKVDWSSLLWNFRENFPGSIFDVSKNAACMISLCRKSNRLHHTILKEFRSDMI